ncbi:hypothetical protein J2W37_003514 [Variovorax paradoxus]|uniref:hypothetical protein n=1 Tax=Variovorax paradoxus TaxID=34073 RepID=UPI002780EB71|nr:hypothetical protein [Variovorax paradoxus]MDP9965787.1 hypothetical protein [Variovorax paradoxus]
MSEKIPADRANEKSESIISIGGLLATASLVGLVLALLGYGVALAAEDRFGIPRAQLLDSTMDMLDLSAWAVLRIISTGFEAFGSLALYVRALKGATPAALILLAAWLVTSLVTSRRGKRKAAIPAESPVPDAPPSKPASFCAALKATWWLPVGVVVTPLLMLLGALTIVVAMTLLAIIPILGMSAGQAYIDEYVVGAENCLPIRNRATRLKQQELPKATSPGTPSAQCVAVTFTEGDLRLQGRVVFALSKAIILYDPETGSVKRIPTESAVVEVVSSL